MWLTPTVVAVNAAERYYETGVWHQGGSAAASGAVEPADLRLALREVVCEECRMGQGLSRKLWSDITCCEQDDDDDDGVWLRVAAADKGDGGGGRKQSQMSDDGTAEWRFRLSQLDVQGVLQRCVTMAAGVSGSLAEVRTAKALLLLVDDMAFDTIADPMARDADMVAPLPLQETDGVFVDGAYNGSVRMLYDGYLQLAYHHFYSWDRGAVQVRPPPPPPQRSQLLTTTTAAVSRRRRRVCPGPCGRSPPGSAVLHQPALAAV